MNDPKQNAQIRAGSPTHRSRGWMRFALHYLEMVVAMFVGMLVLGGVLRAILSAAGVEYSMERYPS
jgi:hypothetical protein